MTAILPPFPYFVFAVFEPISLVGGFLTPLLDPAYFVSAQTPHLLPVPLTAGSQVVALQLGNVYLLLAMIGIGVLSATKDPKVVRNYVIALAIADIGHLASTYYVIGHDNYMDVRGWNSMAWGNIGVTTFLFMTRIGYLSGLFGNDRVASSIRKGL